jgi:branched-chain amino acid transport system substrate-binding protein
MMRLGSIGAVAAATAISLAACGQDDGREAKIPPASPIDAAGCSQVAYGGKGRPDFLIAASSALRGQFVEHGVQTSQAIKLVLTQRGWRAGEYSVGLQICDETAASGDTAGPVKCRRNARAFARNRSVLVVLGPLFSGCAREMLPILNRAPGGPLPAISGSPTYLGLTRHGPGVERGDPERNFPKGQRSFVRILPADDVQGAAGALFAKREGARRAFVLNDGDSYGFGVAEAFRVAAQRSGMDVVGAGRWDPAAHDYRALSERIRRAGADAVYLGGYVSSNGPRLIKNLREALGPDAQLVAPDGFNQPAPIVEGAGALAEGFSPTIAVLPNDRLPAEGREFAAQFEERFSARPCCFSVHSAAAAHMVLDAIGDSGGSRARVLESLLDARVEDSFIGDFEIDRYGDTTLSTIGVYRIEGGRLRFKTAISPPDELLVRE